MLQLKRQQEIINILKEKKEMTVKELCATLYCSTATIRRDLLELEQKGLIKRSFGGAVLHEDSSNELPLSIRTISNVAEKKRICAAAASHIHPGETIFLDSSSTIFLLYPYLKNVENLIVITNNPKLNLVLSTLNVRNFCTGGEMLNHSFALVGSEAERFVRGIRAHSFFFSARGIRNGQIYDAPKEERDLKVAMLEHSSRHYLLYDSSKEGREYPFLITDFSNIDKVFTEPKDPK